MYNEDYLIHYGVKGMKWGVRRAKKFESKAASARNSARELNAMASYEKAKGNVNRSNAYSKRALSDTTKAIKYEQKSKREIKKQDFRDSRANISRSRSLGARLATNVLTGPFANRTYNSVRAAGGGVWAARGATLATGAIFGPVGHLAVSAIMTSDAGRKES